MGLERAGGYRDFSDWSSYTACGSFQCLSLPGDNLRPSLPLRACPGSSLVLTFPPVFSYVEESSSLFWGRAQYCCLSTSTWAVLMCSLTNVISLFRIHGPRVRISSSTIRGPTKVEISVVNHGDCRNQDSNHPCWASRSLFRWASPFLTLAIDFLLPLSDLHKNNVFPLTQYISPLRDFILKILFGNWGRGLFLL